MVGHRLQPRVLFVALVHLAALLLAGVQGRKLAASFRRADGMSGDSVCEASEVHLSLADDQASMLVSWRTKGTDCGCEVQFGLIADISSSAQDGTSSMASAPLKATGTSFQLTESMMCAAPAKKTKFVVTMHTARMSYLEPGRQYWYQLSGSSRSFHFKAPLTPGPHQRLSFVAYGDMGESVHKKQGRKAPMAARTAEVVLSEMERSPLDLVLHVGDLAYADGSHKVWDSFMRAIEPIASRVPYMVGVGNHEYDFVGPGNNDPSGVREPYHPAWGNFGTESGGECGAMTAHRFAMPNVQSGADNAPFWYSFDYGPVHFTMVSTEHDLSPGSLQYRWLARDLASVDRCVTPWLVVGLHRPMYVVYPHKDNRVVGDHLRDFMEDLLLEYDVDLTLSGHVHTYYRTCDVRQEHCVQDGSGISHFIVGTGGHTLSDASDEQKEWLSMHINDWGFMRFDIDRDTMHASFIRSATGDVADRVTLVSRMYSDDECTLARQRSHATLPWLHQEFLQAQAEQQQQQHMDTATEITA